MTRVDPSRLLQRLAPSWFLLLLLLLISARGLLPALLLDRDPNVVFCNTPVGDDPNEGLTSQPSVMRFNTDGFLQSTVELLAWFRTSPRGPPKEFSQEMGIQFACLLLFCSLRTLPTPKPIDTGSSPRDSLSGERVTSLSLLGESEEAMGIEIDNWVLSDCLSTSDQETDGRSDWFLGQSLMNWRRECWDSVSRSVRFWEGSKFLQLINGELFVEGWRKESEVTNPNSLEESSYEICCFRVKYWFSFDSKERSGVFCSLSPPFSFTNILQEKKGTVI